LRQTCANGPECRLLTQKWPWIRFGPCQPPPWRPYRADCGYGRVSAGHSIRRDVVVGRSQSHPALAVTFARQAMRPGPHVVKHMRPRPFEQTRARGGWGMGCSSCRRKVAATWLAIRAAVVISLSGDLTRSWKFQSMFQFGAIFLLDCCSCSSICSASSRHCCAKSAYINRASNVTARLPARSQCCALARHAAALSLISRRYCRPHGRAIATT
jgi:hypothetical protein